ncbi:MAG: hypothetical protein G01um1014106_345, partial [Parcubacteria group bacterium Gr01-1014_106]
ADGHRDAVLLEGTHEGTLGLR